MPYVAAMGQPALEECLNGNKERLSDVVRELRKEGEPFWSQRFVYGKSVESQVVPDRVDGLLHQAAVDIPVKGQTKTQIAAEFEKLPGTGRFYTIIMMSRGGQAAVFARMRVQEVQTTVVLGDGALRILGLLRSEADCPPDVRWCAANAPFPLNGAGEGRGRRAILVHAWTTLHSPKSYRTHILMYLPGDKKNLIFNEFLNLFGTYIYIYYFFYRYIYIC